MQTNLKYFESYFQKVFPGPSWPTSCADIKIVYNTKRRENENDSMVALCVQRVKGDGWSGALGPPHVRTENIDIHVIQKEGRRKTIAWSLYASKGPKETVGVVLLAHLRCGQKNCI